MIDYAPTMCETYPAPPARLDDFQNIFNKGSLNYYPYDIGYNCSDSDAIYHSLMNVRDSPKDDWRYKFISDWTETDTVTWIVDVVNAHCPDYTIPYWNFQVTGQELIAMKRDEINGRFLHIERDPNTSSRIADIVYEKLRVKLNEEINCRQPTVIQYPESETYHPDAETVLDLDSPKDKLFIPEYRPNDSIPYISSDEGESESPVNSNVSEWSKSSDEDDKKRGKRPPGRPRLPAGRKTIKKPRNVSVPEFLRNLLSNKKYCPSIIKWEDYSQRKFRFVKPDEVSKLWGQLKQNSGMTFEKFSRAMRYHYRQAVLVSVPTARLVYQFGVNGPVCVTDNPNFTKLKTEDELDYTSNS